ncbi:hypothetical protein I79_001283 [Cricetulus griseus]|uniref:Uncharacterized protein n=1 Tax=Cricetulus griseus TaxID=10029 RepID=G3GUC9_CRIGR|nr:hypothetical protein I79_001283 [Cricetulus griseus]
MWRLFLIHQVTQDTHKGSYQVEGGCRTSVRVTRCALNYREGGRMPRLQHTCLWKEDHSTYAFSLS